MSVGVSLLDVDHRKLVDILGALQSSMGERDNRELIAATIDTLLEYTVDHFRHEEDAMHLHAYPDTAEHEAEHADLMSKLLDLKEDATAGRITSALALMDFLGAYLTKHMLNSDKKLGTFLRTRLAS